MAKTNRTVLTNNDQEFGQVADPNKIENSIEHAYDVIDGNDDEFITHKNKQVDVTDSNTTKDKHVSNSDLKVIHDDLATKTEKTGDHQGTWQGYQPEEVAEGINSQRIDEIEEELVDTSTTITYHVSTTGDDTNDGMSNTTPFQTLQKAFDVISESYMVIKGTIEIDIAAGTYEESASISGIGSKNRIKLIGKTDSNGVPTVIFEGVNDSSLPYAVSFSNSMNVKIEDIKVQNYANSDTRSGIVAQNYTNLHTKNVHAINSGFAGLNLNNFCRAYVEGGLFDQNRIGIRVYSNCIVTVGYNNATKSYTDPERTLVSNSTESGVFIYNMSTGHLDYSELDANTIGVKIQNESRLHVKENWIKNSVNYGVQVSTSSTWYNNNNTFETNAQDFIHYANSVELGQEKFKTSYFITLDSESITHTGTTTRDTVKTVTIPKGTLANANSGLRVKVFGQINASVGNTASLYCYYGDQNLFGFTSADASNNYFFAEWDVLAIDGNNVLSHRQAREASTNKTNGIQTSIVDSSLNNSLDIRIELTSSTDSVDISGFMVEVIPT